jgi:hypothetical protein
MRLEFPIFPHCFVTVSRLADLEVPLGLKQSHQLAAHERRVIDNQQFDHVLIQ